jgi:hypothetical protein
MIMAVYGRDVKMNMRLSSISMQTIADSDVYALWFCIFKATTIKAVIKSAAVLSRSLTVSIFLGEAHVNYAACLKHLFRLIG